MEMIEGVAVQVTESSQVGSARRRAAEIAAGAGFDETTQGRLAIVVTEAATNLLKHGRGGELFIGPAPGRGVQIIALDRGPGIADVAGSLRDGYSTVGTRGTGLGAIARASNTFDLYSTPDGGTAVAATVFANGCPVPPVGGLSVPMRGESRCGDGWAVWSAGELLSIFVCDGLGHGPEAADATRVAIAAFLQHAERPAPAVIEVVFDAMRSTRGGAVAVAALDAREGTAHYCGMGNIAGVIVPPEGAPKHLVSHNGIAGHTRRRFQEFVYAWPPGSLLIMHSDGIGTAWSLDRYAGLRARRPDVIAGVLYRDAARGRDDATVVVARNGTER